MAVDRENDLALVAILAGYVDYIPIPSKKNPEWPLRAPLKLAITNRPEVGDEVYVVGNPQGLKGTFSQGIISSLRDDGYLQITAPISRGSSGGPVLNKYGQVIGIVVGAIE